jgi:hypothetical protein
MVKMAKVVLLDGVFGHSPRMVSRKSFDKKSNWE